MATAAKKLGVHYVMFDGGDGGGTTYLYTTDKELIDKVNERCGTTFENVDDVIEYLEEDEYERGYYGRKILEYKIVKGELRFVGNWSFHWGQ